MPEQGGPKRQPLPSYPKIVVNRIRGGEIIEALRTCLTKILSGEAHPRFRWGSLQRSSRLLSWITGAYFYMRGRETREGYREG